MEPEVLALLIPITAIVMSIGLAMIVTIATHRRRSQAIEQRHRERMAAIEKGIELPPDANDPEAQLELAKAMRKPRFLLRGLIFTAIGGALVASWSNDGDNVIMRIGWVAVAIGVAQLLYYAIEGRKERGPTT